MKGKKKNAKQKRFESRSQYAGRHITDITADGGAGKLESVTDRNELDEFLCNALLAETTFEAERERNIIILGSTEAVGTVDAVQPKESGLQNADEDYQYDHLPVPRRPKWNKETSAEQLDLEERTAFLEWRRALAQVEESTLKAVTPFEKNLEVWRQLWRVVERSDVVVQVIDARNPLLYRCEDLEKYVHEVDPTKICVLLVNKADFLTRPQRRAWAEFFKQQGVEFAFFSAAREQIDIDARNKELRDVQKQRDKEIAMMRKHFHSLQEDSSSAKDTSESESRRGAEENPFGRLHNDDDDEDLDDVEEADEEADDDDAEEDNVKESTASDDAKEQKDDEEDEEDDAEEEDSVAHVDDGGVFAEDEHAHADDGVSEKTPAKSALKPTYAGDAGSQILSRKEFLQFCATLFRNRVKEPPQSKDGRITIGMVGYPNVGKSSTINALCETKRVSVAPTPGHTKHFQTVNIGDDICVCDCPGLVFPTTLSSAAELTVSGVLPIDQCRDFKGPIQVLCERISREQLFYHYGLKFPKWAKINNQELMEKYALQKGFMKDQGRPDDSRAARYLLKDYTSGKLLFCYPPPHLSSDLKKQFIAAVTGRSLAGNLAETAFGAQPVDEEESVTRSNPSLIYTKTAPSLAERKDDVLYDNTSETAPDPVFDAMYRPGAQKQKLSRKDISRQKKINKKLFGKKARNAFGSVDVGHVEAHTKGKFAQHGFRRTEMGKV